ncbi:Folylpolyglutamate synthase [Triticum urartu]|uniref:Folylpolyglutamate synthase n=1 Tax=Triticum urartu TaxID=4572 RepID=M8AEN3_TRIUA|nr:Folylpolyglutamate synthase [Triticum urartu]
MAGGGEEAQLGGFLEYMDMLRNYERSGVPRGAGTDSDDGFDLGRMRRLLRRLGDPHTHYPSVHIAGTKGKGSTAAFLSNIMREQGYNVGCYSSPHLLTIRERISVGQHGGPVSAASLRDLFDLAKEAIDESIESENGSLTHFEVFTALSFLLFSRENVDVAIVEVVIGGPFSTDIEQIIRDRAFLTQSPVISACDTGVRSITRCIGRDYAKPYQSCDIVVKISGNMPLSVELHDVKLQLLGGHQRQNAVTASCTALCLRELGRRPDVVLLTETGIAGGTARSMPASSLRDIWTGAALGQGIECVDIGAIAGNKAPNVNIDHLAPAAGTDKPAPMLIGCGAAPFSRDLMKAASRLLRRAVGGGAARGGLICVTGSMHMVASVLQQLEQ